MPSIIGPIKINSVSSAGGVFFGDALNLSPENNTKTYVGSGSDSTGDFQIQTVRVSHTNVIDPDIVDEMIIGK